jgi:hypothetical protein
MVGCNACISSLKGVVVQNHSLSKLQKKEQLLVVPLNNVAEEDIDEQHFNTHETVPKYDVNGVSLPEGRVCMNASFSKAGESRNSGLDRGVSEIHYPAEVLVDVSDLCERACNVRDEFPNEEIHGTLVDYTKAYNLEIQSRETAKLCSSVSKMKIGGVDIVVLLVYLVGIFGCADAGNWFAVLARAVSFLHNLIYHSFRYVDDNMITDTASRIKASENNLVKHVKYLLGTDAVNE